MWSVMDDARARDVLLARVRPLWGNPAIAEAPAGSRPLPAGTILKGFLL